MDGGCYTQGLRTNYSGLLGFLQGDLLAGIAHALALVGLRRTERADLGRNFADALLVRTLDEDLGLRRGLERDAFGRVEHDRVREAQAQAQRLAGHRSAVTHADQLQLALVTLGHALDHGGQQRTRGTAELVVGALGQRDAGNAVIDGHGHARQGMHRQPALRALDGAAVGVGLQIHAHGQVARMYGNAGHGNSLRHLADDFAAQTLGTGLRIGHQTGGSRYDRDTHAAEHLRQLVLAAVNAQAGAGNTGNGLDGRAAFEILELDLEHRLAFLVGSLGVEDVALVLEEVGDRQLQLRRRHAYGLLARELGIADARKQIGDGISHAHENILQSAPISDKTGNQSDCELTKSSQPALRRPTTIAAISTFSERRRDLCTGAANQAAY